MRLLKKIWGFLYDCFWDKCEHTAPMIDKSEMENILIEEAVGAFDSRTVIVEPSFITEMKAAGKRIFEAIDKKEYCGGSCGCDGNCGDDYKCDKDDEFWKDSEQFAQKLKSDPEERHWLLKIRNEKNGEAKRKMRKVYHVVSNPKGGWLVKEEKNKNPSARADKKSEAVGKAKELAKKAKLGQVIVHKKNGIIQTEYTYGEDPVKTKG